VDGPSVCAVCGSCERQSLFQAQDLLYGMAIQARVVQCDSCGLVYLMPQPARPQDYYPGEYAPHAPGSADIARSMGLRAGLLRKVRVAQRYGRGPWLDIGCAAGEFLATMQSLGCGPLWGMDQSEQAVLSARRRYGLDVWRGDVPGLPFADGTVGTVTMWHVLEHLPRPQAALQDVARVLCADGVLVVACPMVDSWEARLFGRHWAGYDVPRHLYAFSRQTLPRLLQQAGFEAFEMPGVVWGYNSAKISSVLWLQERLLRRGSRLLRVGAALLAVGTSSMFGLFSKIFGERGSVAVFVAHKCAQIVERPTIEGYSASGFV
jgi:SAM-dependent methyltransferase